jgi:hypothetical protein
MINSIQLFEESGILNLLSIEKQFIKDFDFTALEQGIGNEVLKLGLNIITEVLERLDTEICNDPIRKAQGWEIVRKDTKSIVTYLGTVTFKKTLFLNKHTRERTYLLDKNIGFDKDLRMTENAEAHLLKEAVQSTYRQGGEAVSIADNVSKETVMDKLRVLDFNKVHKVPEKKREVPFIYIDADEDHVALQYLQKHNDLVVNEHNRKNNCALVKLIYVYEGIEPESPKSKRHRLINRHCFSGVYDGKDNARLWEEVYDYLDETYDLTKVEKVYLNSDGGSWIKGASQYLHGLSKVLDEFHLNKYLLKMVGGLMDSAAEVRKELINDIRYGKKEDFGHLTEQILSVTESESAQKRIAESANYILSNWMPARTRLNYRRQLPGCSAEGHVSHILSDRMSSRPLGWSRAGADKMAHLRAYYFNGGDMLELVRAQKLPKAAGSENELFFMDPRKIGENTRNDWGKYVDRANHEVSALGQKLAWFNAQIKWI